MFPGWVIIDFCTVITEFFTVITDFLHCDQNVLRLVMDYNCTETANRETFPCILLIVYKIIYTNQPETASNLALQQLWLEN